jgi:uncharacterized protein with PQ loop repeat
MTAADLGLLAFTLCNSLRVLAYVPQILRLSQDKEGAKAISVTTWAMFAVSHVSTVLYAAVTVCDPAMTLIFTANAAACLLIVTLTGIKRAKLSKEAPRLLARAGRIA